MLRRLSLALAAAMALAACNPDVEPASPSSNVPASPSSVANRTTLDETALRSIEVAYMAARTAAELAVDLGRIKGDRATRFRVLNRRAYDSVLAARTAYRAGNSASYTAAARETLSLVNQLLQLAKGL